MNQIHFPIHPLVFRRDVAVAFDVYYRTPSEGLEVLIPAGESYTDMVHKRLGNHPTASLYIRKADIYRYYRYLEKYLPDIYSDDKLNTQEKAKIAHHLLSGIAHTQFTNPTQEGLARYKSVIEVITRYVLTEEDVIFHLIRNTNPGSDESNHNINVGIYGLGLAKEMLNEKTHNMPEIAAGFFLHDIGKYSIPKHLSYRNGPLSDHEWATVKKHPEEGFKLLKKFNIMSDEIQTIVLQHHERYDGSGYPLGIRGDQIHTYSKICAIADTFDALTSERPYRDAQSSFRALAIMKNEMRDVLDPELFSQFVLLFSKQAHTVSR